MSFFQNTLVEEFIINQKDIIKKRIELLNENLDQEKILSHQSNIIFSIKKLCIAISPKFNIKKVDKRKLNVSYGDNTTKFRAAFEYITKPDFFWAYHEKLKKYDIDFKFLVFELFKLIRAIEDKTKSPIDGRARIPEEIIEFIFEIKDCYLEITNKKNVTIYTDRRGKKGTYGIFYDFFSDCYPNLILKSIFPKVRPSTLSTLLREYNGFNSYLKSIYKIDKIKAKKKEFRKMGFIQDLQKQKDEIKIKEQIESKHDLNVFLEKLIPQGQILKKKKG